MTRSRNEVQQDHIASPCTPTTRAHLGHGQDALEDTLARDTGGQVRPQYKLVPRTAGQLACGELVIEPILGVVRVAAVRPAERDHDTSALVHLTWTDDHGPCEAAGSYPIDRAFLVRIPDHADQLQVRQGIDQATWRRGVIPGQIARLIAAHLHVGPRSAMYGFAVNGGIRRHLLAELRHVGASRPIYGTWVSALMRYCQSRSDKGPVAGWGPGAAPIPHQALGLVDPHQGRITKGRRLPLTAKKSMPTDMAMQLIDAAFALGVDAGRSTITMARARQLLAQRATI